MNLPATLPEFRSIDITGYTRTEVKDQPQPMLIWAEIEALVIDPRYQRDITPKGKSAIMRMARDWDWRKYQPILVAPTFGGKMAVVDGQHRAHAAAVAGLTKLPAMTVAMTLAEQASGFTAVNRDRVTVDALSIYRAALAAGDPDAIAIRTAVEAAGVRVATSTPSALAKKPRIIYAIGLLKRMTKNGEAEAITAGLCAITQSSAADELDSYSGTVLAVWLGALATNQRFLSLDLPQLFDSFDILGAIDGARIKSRQTGESARAIVTQQVIETLTRAKEAAA